MLWTEIDDCPEWCQRVSYVLQPETVCSTSKSLCHDDYMHVRVSGAIGPPVSIPSSSKKHRQRAWHGVDGDGRSPLFGALQSCMLVNILARIFGAQQLSQKNLLARMASAWSKITDLMKLLINLANTALKECHSCSLVELNGVWRGLKSA